MVPTTDATSQRVNTTNGVPAQRGVNPTAKKKSKRNRKKPQRLNPETAKLVTADAMVATAILKQTEHKVAHLAATEAEIVEAIKNINFDANPTPLHCQRISAEKLSIQTQRN